jgi:hypothetical protein
MTSSKATGEVLESELRGIVSGMGQQGRVSKIRLEEMRGLISEWWEENGVISSPPIEDLKRKMKLLESLIDSILTLEDYLRGKKA